MGLAQSAGVCKIYFSGAANAVPVKLLGLHDCTNTRVVSKFSACAHARRGDHARIRTCGNTELFSTRSGGFTGLALL